ncbi:MAG: PEP-CTERM sorting domain-containing protein [Thiohalomonadales bacterium]
MKRILFLLIGLSLNANVMAGSIWAPNSTSADSNFLTFSKFDAGILGLFDAKNLDFSMPGLMLNNFDTVDFAQTASGSTISNGAGDTSFLSGTGNFILGMSFDQGASWVSDFVSVEFLANETYAAFFGDNNIYGVSFINDVMAVDHTHTMAVPEPAILWLFSIGLFLVWLGYSRRKPDASIPTAHISPS